MCVFLNFNTLSEGFLVIAGFLGHMVWKKNSSDEKKYKRVLRFHSYSHINQSKCGIKKVLQLYIVNIIILLSVILTK